MKDFCVLFSFLLNVSILFAQPNCLPDTTIQEPIQVIHPQPFDVDFSPFGGIRDTACVGQAFEFTFTILMPGTITIGGITLPASSWSLPTQGGLSYEPPLASFNYVCDPPNCIFPAGQRGCIKIFGTAEATETGPHVLTFIGNINTSLVIPVAFPDGNLLIGEYSLVVYPEDATQCRPSAAISPALSGVEIIAITNPFAVATHISVKAERAGNYSLQVSNLFGQLLHRQPVDIRQGENTIAFDNSNLSPGIYLLTLSGDRGSLSCKLLVRHH